MPVQTALNIDTTEFILSEYSKVLEAETLAQDGARAAVMAPFTIMAQVPTTQLWTPWIDETAVDGTEFPLGFLLASVTAAELVAGNVVNIPILTMDAVIDISKIVFEAAITLAEVIATLNITAEQFLQLKGIAAATTVDVDAYENA